MAIVTSLLICVLLAFSGFTRSQIIKFDQPNGQTDLEPGLTCSISWHLEESDTQNFTHVNLYLMQFVFGQFLIVLPIEYNVAVFEISSIDWKIPNDDILHGQYVIGAVTSDYEYQSYSDYFWILRDYYFTPSTK